MHVLIQVLTTLLCCLIGVAFGISMAYLSMAAALFLEPDNGSGLVLTKSQSSWFGKLDMLHKFWYGKNSIDYILY